MLTSKSEVKVYYVEPYCDVCGEPMERSNIIKPTYPPIYTYNCTSCDFSEDTHEQYPHTIYEKVK